MASRNYYTSVVMGSTFSNTKSLQFNGTTGYLRIPSPSASLQLNGLTNSHTISVWLKYPSIPANHLVIGNSANTVTKGFGMGYFAGRWYYWFSAGGANRMFQASPNNISPVVNQWNNLIFNQPTAGTLADAYWVFNGTQIFYNDASSGGVLIDSLTGNTNTAIPVYSGTVTSLATYYNGLFDELSVNIGALTLADCVDIYNGGTPKDISSYSPDFWWRFEDNYNEQGGADAWTNNLTTFSSDVP